MIPTFFPLFLCAPKKLHFNFLRTLCAHAELLVFSHSINVNVLLTLNFAGFTEPRSDVVEMHSPVALNVN